MANRKSSKKVPARAGHLGILEILVMLAILHLGDKAFGSGIALAITEAGITTRPGAVHTTTTRLEKKGMLKGKLGEPTRARGGRAKRYFTLSVSGKSAVRHSFMGIRALAAGSF